MVNGYDDINIIAEDDDYPITENLDEPDIEEG